MEKEGSERLRRLFLSICFVFIIGAGSQMFCELAQNWGLMNHYGVFYVLQVEAAETYCTSYEEAGAVLRNGIKNRSALVTIHYRQSGTTEASGNDFNNIFNEIWKASYAETEAGTEGEYIRWNVASINSGDCTYTPNTALNSCDWTIIYNLTYYTTASQEAELDAKVASVLSSLNLSSKTDYEKAYAIYHYICQNVTYDTAHQNDSSYTLKHTAYAALINHTAVCQGFALLYYRMAMQAGLPCRVITGTKVSTGGTHAWNIVQINGSYYYVDPTFDAGNSSYVYFLKGSNSFNNRVSTDYLNALNVDEEYTTNNFKAAYPISATDYEIPKEVTGKCGDNLTWKYLEDEKTLAIVGTGDMYDWSSDEYVPWVEWREEIEYVELDDGVTSIGDYAFYGATTLIRLTGWDNVTSIGDYAFYYCNKLNGTIPMTFSFPSGLKSIGTQAFAGCGSLISTYFKGNLPSIGTKAFYGNNMDMVTPPADDTWADVLENPSNYQYGGKLTWTRKSIFNLEVDNNSFPHENSSFPKGYHTKYLSKLLAFTSNQGLRDKIINSEYEDWDKWNGSCFGSCVAMDLAKQDKLNDVLGSECFYDYGIDENLRDRINFLS